MPLRRFLPIIIGVSVFLGLAILVGVLIAGSKDDEYYIARAAHRIAVERYEAQKLVPEVDYRFESVKVFSRDEKRALVRVSVARKGPTDAYYWELEKGGGDWTVGRDLQEHFAVYCKDDEVQKGLGVRFEQALADRYKPPIDVDAPSFRYIIGDQDNDVTATTDFMFKAGTSKCRYIEVWRYKNRVWVVDGVGRIFEGTR